MVGHMNTQQRLCIQHTHTHTHTYTHTQRRTISDNTHTHSHTHAHIHTRAQKAHLAYDGYKQCKVGAHEDGTHTDGV